MEVEGAGCEVGGGCQGEGWGCAGGRCSGGWAGSAAPWARAVTRARRAWWGAGAVVGDEGWVAVRVRGVTVSGPPAGVGAPRRAAPSWSAVRTVSRRGAVRWGLRCLRRGAGGHGWGGPSGVRGWTCQLVPGLRVARPKSPAIQNSKGALAVGGAGAGVGGGGMGVRCGDRRTGRAAAPERVREARAGARWCFRGCVRRPGARAVRRGGQSPGCAGATGTAEPSGRGPRDLGGRSRVTAHRPGAGFAGPGHGSLARPRPTMRGRA